MNNQEIYLPNYHQKHQLIITWQSIFRDVWQYRHFIKQMTYISLLSEYKKSWLGITWMILSPIFANVLWLLLNASGIFNPGNTGIPYPAFTLFSTVIWGFFHTFYMSISDIIIQRSGILLQKSFFVFR
jgi:lipopolysaccharide transport system permease protein